MLVTSWWPKFCYSGNQQQQQQQLQDIFFKQLQLQLQQKINHKLQKQFSIQDQIQETFNCIKSPRFRTNTFKRR